HVHAYLGKTTNQYIAGKTPGYFRLRTNFYIPLWCLIARIVERRNPYQRLPSGPSSHTGRRFTVAFSLCRLGICHVGAHPGVYYSLSSRGNRGLVFHSLNCRTTAWPVTQTKHRVSAV